MNLLAEVQEVEDQKQFDRTCKNWCTIIRTSVGRKYFKFMQFTSDKKDACGSDWMKLVCDEAQVPEDKREVFWNRAVHGGKSMARATINRRRMNVTNAIKGVFLGKWWREDGR